jgi:L-alanine-DL-glutamate epimerase-like enolase superfamily enzyme
MRIERIVRWRRSIAAGDARSSWTTRHGWLVVVEHAGVRGIGECSPLPGFGGTAAAAMRFALETAALDALTRARGVPLAAALVDAPATRVPLNALVTDPGGAASAAARGIAVLKVKVGPADCRPLLASLVGAAPAARLRLDANLTWPLAEVSARLAALAHLPIDYVEEPAAGLGPSLTRRLPLPIALDESLADPDRDQWLDRALASSAIAALILKPTILGGFAACATLAARARAHGVASIVTHALEGPVGTAACASLALAVASSVTGFAEHPSALASSVTGFAEHPSALASSGTGVAEYPSALAVGLDRHSALLAWDLEVPHLAPAAVVLPRAPGLGLDIDAVLAAADRCDGAAPGKDAP